MSSLGPDAGDRGQARGRALNPRTVIEDWYDTVGMPGMSAQLTPFQEQWHLMVSHSRCEGMPGITFSPAAMVEPEADAAPFVDHAASTVSLGETPPEGEQSTGTSASRQGFVGLLPTTEAVHESRRSASQATSIRHDDAIGMAAPSPSLQSTPLAMSNSLGGAPTSSPASWPRVEVLPGSPLWAGLGGAKSASESAAPGSGALASGKRPAVGANSECTSYNVAAQTGNLTPPSSYNSDATGTCKMKGVDSGDCESPDIRTTRPSTIFDLDWRAACNRFTIAIEDAEDLPGSDETICMFFSYAMAIARDSKAFIKWARCMTDKGEADCIRGRVHGSEEYEVPVFIQLRAVEGGHNFAAWPPWSVELDDSGKTVGALIGMAAGALLGTWPAILIGAVAGWLGGDGIIMREEYEPSDIEAATEGGYIFVNTDKDKTFWKQAQMLYGSEWDWVAGLLDLAVAIVHEMSHVCNTQDDVGDCKPADLLETAYQFALANRYPTVGKGSNCAALQLSTLERDGTLKMFVRDESTCEISPYWELFGSDGTASLRPIDKCGA